jgi:glycosyltransferase involved in cell wall biosynthesis
MSRLLLLCEHPTLLGGERSVLAVLGAVTHEDFLVTVAAPPEGPLAEACREQGLEVLPLVSRDAGGNRMSQRQRRDRIAQHIATARPDLLHANSLAMGRLVGPVAAELGVPSIAHVRDIIRLSAQAVADVNRNTRLLAVSNATRAFHVAGHAAAGGLSAEKTHVLYNGVDLERFRPREATGFLHRQLGLSPDVPLAGAIGQIGLRKGHDLLARAAAILAGELPELHYVIVGRRWSDKAESRRFEADLHAAAQGLPGRFHFLGVRDDVERILVELTLLVHPARQEPLGRVLLEGAAAGVAIVATDVGGTAEIFPPQSRAARLVPPDDADALAAAILELMSDEPLRARLAAQARRRAEEAFDAKRAAARLIKHYREVEQP